MVNPNHLETAELEIEGVQGTLQLIIERLSESSDSNSMSTETKALFGALYALRRAEQAIDDASRERAPTTPSSPQPTPAGHFRQAKDGTVKELLRAANALLESDEPGSYAALLRGKRALSSPDAEVDVDNIAQPAYELRALLAAIRAQVSPLADGDD